MKKTKITALLLCASMLAGITGCGADQSVQTAASPTATEASSEDTTPVTEESEPVVDSGVDYLEGHEKFEVTSTDLENGVWADIISTIRGDNKSPELSWDPVEGAAEYIVYMVDMNTPDLPICGVVHWRSSGITETELPQGWASSRDYIGPSPQAGVTHIYEIYVVALKEPVEKLKGGIGPLIRTSFESLIQGLDIDSEGNTGNILAYGKISGNFSG